MKNVLFRSSFKALLRTLLAAAAAFVWFSGQAQLPAFPGAEGYGKYASGGRGTPATPTTVFEVTSLEDINTPGTLRNALSAPATYRTVVFRVAGTIRLKSKLSIPANTTIAGQTAPGGGICLADHPVVISGDNVILRFIRVRMGDRYQNKGKVDGSGGDDALGNLGNKRIIIDHCSVSWSSDEALTIYRGDSVTLQWNIISEPLNYSYHFESGGSDYQEHGYGGIWGSRNGSFHHNLILHVKGRAPRFAGNSTYPAGVVEKADFRNNVIYNWRDYSTNGGEGGTYNLVNNYYKYGPSTSTGTSSGVPKRGMIMNPSKSSSLGYPKIYLSGNFVDGYSAITAANWKGMAMADGGTLADTALSKTNAPFPWDSVVTHSATEAYELVLAHAGAALPLRDTLDQRLVSDVRNRAGRIIDVQGGFPHGTPFEQTIGAWPALASGTPPADTDKDGMPDTWETAQGLDPQNPSDRSGIAPNGYTHLENYLNGLVSPLIPVGTTGFLPREGFNLYPNPVFSEIALDHPAYKDSSVIALFNGNGATMQTAVCAPGSVKTTLRVELLPAGMYFLIFQNEGKRLTLPFVKK
ncbi:MAG: T9SS type A sorting domain-containing protein [Haliscomenobacter sp.]|nr:T9SS type A sorting domain-containing protein [Haliscomenobacter sp.]MBK8876999.1 T9SS type A sorting domain-containing protein [Haliscomenobacter sp.]